MGCEGSEVVDFFVDCSGLRGQGWRAGAGQDACRKPAGDGAARGTGKRG